ACAVGEGRVGLPRYWRRDPRGDRAREDRPLRSTARGAAGRALPPLDLDVPARMGGGTPPRALCDPGGRRLVVGPCRPTAGRARAMRLPPSVLPRRLRRGTE